MISKLFLSAGISASLTRLGSTAQLMSEAPASVVVERRGSPRHRTLLGVQIVFRDGMCSMSGQILNLSETGALVRPVEMALCPDKFLLRPRLDPPHQCEVVWRNDEVVGVRFVS